MSKATEVMMQYVENLKRTYEKDHAELMEFKKLANQNSNRSYGGSVEPGGRMQKDGFDDVASVTVFVRILLRSYNYVIIYGSFSNE